MCLTVFLTDSCQDDKKGVYLAFTAVKSMAPLVAKPLTEKTVRQLFGSWRESLDRGENTLILAAPRMDRSYRIPEFIQFLGAGYDVFVVNLEAQKIEDFDDWNKTTSIHRRDSKKKHCYLIPDAELLFQDRKHLLAGLVSQYIETKTPFLLFSEAFPYQILPQVFAQNRIVQALYSPDDVIRFISYLEHKFGGSVPANARNRIAEQTGGHLWLVKEIVRYMVFRETGDSFDHEDLWWRVGEVYRGFATREQEVLTNLVLKTPVKDVEARDYLEHMGVVHDGRIAIGLLEEYIKKQAQERTQLTLKNGLVYAGGVPVDAALSKNEKQALTCILLGDGNIVSRETLGNDVWGDEGDFTDWALDQLVRRLRRKLATFGVPENFIQTVKRKGYHVAG